MCTQGPTVSCQTDLDTFDFELLQHYRRNEEFCDVVLQSTVDESKKMIRCHKIILATVSPFFRKEFERRDKACSNVYVEGIDEETLQMLIDFMYGGILNLTKENVFQIFPGAQHLKLQRLGSRCMDYIQNLISVEEVIPILQFALSQSSDVLIQICMKFILNNLDAVKGHGFLNLEPECVRLIAKHQVLHGFPPADAILQAGIEWLHADEGGRGQHAFDVINAVPLKKIGLKALRKFLREDPFLERIEQVHNLYVDTIEEIGMRLEEAHAQKRKSDIFGKDPLGSKEENKDLPLSEATTSKRARLRLEAIEQPTELATNQLHQIGTNVVNNESKSNKARIYFILPERVETGFQNSIVSVDLELNGYETVGTHLGFQKTTSLVYHSDKIYSLGDCEERNSVRHNFVSVFNVRTKTWETNAPEHVEARMGFKPFVHGDFLYAVGGWTNVPTPSTSSNIERLNLTETPYKTWSEVKSMPMPSCTFGICGANGCIFVMGGTGWNGVKKRRTISDKVLCYSPTSQIWTVKKSMPVPRRWLAVAAVGKIIFAMGGITKLRGSDPEHAQSTVDVYDIETNSWSSGVPMNKKRQCFSAVVHNNFIYAIGGDSKDYPTMERFSIQDQIWEDVGRLPTNGFYHSVVLCTDEL